LYSVDGHQQEDVAEDPEGHCHPYVGDEVWSQLDGDQDVGHPAQDVEEGQEFDAQGVLNATTAPVHIAACHH